MRAPSSSGNHTLRAVDDRAGPRGRVSVRKLLPPVMQRRAEPTPRFYGLALGVVVGAVFGTLLGAWGAGPLGVEELELPTAMLFAAIAGAVCAGLAGTIMGVHIAKRMGDRARDAVRRSAVNP